MQATIEYIEDFQLRKTHIRPEIAAFAIEMEKVLSDNDHKTGWYNLSIHTLYNRIKQEFKEFQEQYIIMNDSLTDDVSFIQNMRKESIDIANYCMFLCHNYPKEKPKE